MNVKSDDFQIKTFSLNLTPSVETFIFLTSDTRRKKNKFQKNLPLLDYDEVIFKLLHS